MSILPQRLPQQLSDRLGRGLARLGVTANALTTLGMLGNVAAAALVAGGELLIGGVVFLLFSALDMLDGAVARATGTATPFGAVYDAVLDRLGEAALLAGAAWHFAERGDEAAVGGAYAALAGSILVSYVRARAEKAGGVLREGLFRRQERVLLLGLGLILGWLAAAVYATAALTHLTAVQRFWMLARALRSGEP